LAVPSGEALPAFLPSHVTRFSPSIAHKFRRGTKFFTARWRLICFNDDPEIGHGDVIALIDRTISQLASQAPALPSTISLRSPTIFVHT
jgi:hypothetical protein